MRKYQAVKLYVGVEVQFHAFLSLALHISKLSASRPKLFTLEDKALCMTVGWPQNSLDTVA
jgi:hypothetical protein